jgi:hypothetical protein
VHSQPSPPTLLSPAGVSQSPNYAAFCREIATRYPLNCAALSKHFRQSCEAPLKAEHRQRLFALADAAEEARANVFARIPSAYLGIDFLGGRGAQIEDLLARYGKVAPAVLALLGEDAFEYVPAQVSFVEAVVSQGPATASAALLCSPKAWLTSEADRILAIREHFGVCAQPILARLGELHPAGWGEELDALSGTDLGLSPLGLLVREKDEALVCLREHAATLRTLERICRDAGRSDAFVAATLHLNRALLAGYSDAVIRLARINPAKLPDIVEGLKPELLGRVPRLIEAVVRSGRSRIAPAMKALNLVAPPEEEFILGLIERSGVFSAPAIERRGPQLLEADPPRHQAIAKKYGHAYWGLADRLRDRLHQLEESHREFIDEARTLTGVGAGSFFAAVPEEQWTAELLDFARRYGAASGHIAKRWGASFLELERQPRFRELALINRELFNISWLHRYAEPTEDGIDDTLLERNIRNMSLPLNPRRALAVCVVAKCDPLDTFASPVYSRFLRELGERAQLFVAEAETVDDISRVLADVTANPLYGGSVERPRMLDLLVLCAHSDGFELQLGGTRHVPAATEEESSVRDECFLGEKDAGALAEWGKRLGPGGTLVLFACSVFFSRSSPRSLGPVFEEAFPSARVHGLSKPGSFVGFELDGRGVPSRIHWKDGYTWR